ncbi:MAG TPA: hypothetical protein VLY82_01970 [Nitrososphaerales archaeon]|nr:hypothetical protein [Nitrososphaerales archaeon]
MLAKGLIRSQTVDGFDVFSISDEEYRLYKDWLEIWNRLPLELPQVSRPFMK